VDDGATFIGMSAVLGFGAALCAPAATGILSESLPDGKFKNGAFACLGAGQPLGFIMGLIIGGVFAKDKYRIYLIAIVAAALFAFIALCTLPQDGVRLLVKGSNNSEENQESTPGPRAPGSLLLFDWTGAALSTVGIILLTLGLAFASSESRGWDSVPVLVSLPLSVVFIAAFFLWESYQERQYSSYEEGQTPQALTAPLIPPSLWKAPGFSPTLACIFFAWLSFNALSYHATLVYQEVQDYSPIQTSIRFLPMVGSGLFLNAAGGYLVSRLNAFWLFLIGCVGGAASCLIFSLVNPDQAYAKGFLWVMILNVFPDIFFPAAQLFACST
jgi:MFS family permease